MDLNGTVVDVKEAISIYNKDFIYRLGEVVESEFDTNRWNECSTGIHFFMTFEEARDYNLF